MPEVVIAGVGGQGVAQAASILCAAARLAGFSFAGISDYGLARRNGSIVAHVRVRPSGTEPLWPRIRDGSGDLLLGFEPVEAMRYAPSLKAGARVLVDDRPIVPLSVSARRDAAYPDVAEITAALGSKFAVRPWPASGIASAAGDERALNVVMLGLADGLGWLPDVGARLGEAVEAVLPAVLREVNLRALEMARNEGASAATPNP